MSLLLINRASCCDNLDDVIMGQSLMAEVHVRMGLEFRSFWQSSFTRDLLSMFVFGLEGSACLASAHANVSLAHSELGVARGSIFSNLDFIFVVIV